MPDLTHLSFVRVPPGHQVPSPPTDQERLQAFRAATADPRIGNQFFRTATPSALTKGNPQ